jgi:hypothetical protein
MKDTKTLTKEAYNELVNELNAEINAKKAEYDKLEIKRLKKYIQNEVAFCMGGEEDRKGYQIIADEVYEKINIIVSEVKKLEYKLANLEEYGARYILKEKSS